MRFPFIIKPVLLFVVPIMLLAAAAVPVFADCTRHVYNRSLDVWAYGFTADSTTKLGTDSPRILPGESKPIEYQTGAADSAQKWLTVEQITEVSGKEYYRTSFRVEGCYLRHDGVTGRAVLNDPADGDVIFID